MAGLEFRVSCIQHVVVQKHPLNLPSRELAYIPPGEEENHRLKSAKKRGT